MSDPQLQQTSTAQQALAPPQPQQDAAKQTKLVLKLFFSALAITGLFLPWVTIFSVSLSGWCMQIGPLLAVCLVLAAASLVYEHMQGQLPILPAIRASIWAVCAAIAGGYALYWGSFVVLRCLGIAIVIFGLVTIGMLVAEVRDCDLSNRRYPLAVAGFVVALAAIIGLANGHTASTKMQGRRATPTMEEAFSAAVSDAFKGMLGSTSGSPIPSTARPFLPSPPVASSPAFTPPSPPKMDVKCVSWSESYQLGSGDWSTRVDSGKKFVVMKVSVTNRDNDKTNVSADDFKVTCDNRNVYDSKGLFFGSTGLNLISVELLPGGSTTGDVVFVVDQAAKPVSVEYTGGPF